LADIQVKPFSTEIVAIEVRIIVVHIISTHFDPIIDHCTSFSWEINLLVQYLVNIMALLTVSIAHYLQLPH